MTQEAEVGVPLAWRFGELPSTCGPLLLRDFRSRQPTNINVLLAMYAELYRRRLRRPRLGSAVLAVAGGALTMVKGIFRWSARRGRAARENCGRSTIEQAVDMARIWAYSDMRPRDYYFGVLARHDGGSEIYDYVNWSIFRTVVMELQRATFGMPAVPINDKGTFARWCKTNGLRTPRQFVLDPGAPAPPDDAISALGDELIVKPRSSMMARDLEAWTHGADGIWTCDSRRLEPTDLAQWLARRAANDVGGIVVQERLYNPPSLIDLFGSVLTNCRVVTLLNEQDKPEVVQFLWRMNHHSGKVIVNVRAGGMWWAVSDLETGAIEIAFDKDTEEKQTIRYNHPVTGQPMVGVCHPAYRQICDFAEDAHVKLGDVVCLGWDIAMTPEGPTMLEVNFPPGLDPRVQLEWNGIGKSRFGDLLAWHARRWLEEHLDPTSRRAVGASAEG